MVATSRREDRELRDPLGRIGGTVGDVVPRSRLHVLLDEPVHGATILVAEGTGDQVSVSMWLLLYGPDPPAIARRDEPHVKLP